MIDAAHLATSSTVWLSAAQGWRLYRREALAHVPTFQSGEPMLACIPVGELHIQSLADGPLPHQSGVATRPEGAFYAHDQGRYWLMVPVPV